MSKGPETPSPRRGRIGTDTPRLDLTELSPQELIARVRLLQSRVDELTAENERLQERKSRTRVLASARQLQTTFDAIRDGICLLDWKGRILRCNQAFLAFLGKTNEEIVGRVYTEVLRVIPAFVEALPVEKAWQMRARAGIDLFLNDRWYAVTVDPLLDEEGKSGGAVCQVRDITARKEAEQQVRETERRMRIAVSQAPAILWTTDTQLRFTSSLGAGLVALGQGTDEVVGTDLFEYFKTDDREFTPIAAHRRALAGESCSYDMEWSGRTFQSHVEPLRNVEGTIVGTIGIAQDVTERVAAERERIESERRFRALVAQVPAIVWTTDYELRITFSIGAGLAVLGLKPNQLVGTSIPDSVGSHDPEYLPNAMHLRALSGESVTYEMDFRARSWTTHIEPLKDARGRITGVIGVCQDITEQKRAEAALRESEERFRKMFDRCPVGIALADSERRIVMANPTLEEMLGYAPGELIGRNGRDITHPDDREATTEAARRALEPDEPIVTVEKRSLRKDGSVLWGKLTIRALRDVQGNFLHYLGMLEDVTEKRRAEDALRETQERFRMVFEGSPIGVSMVGRDRRFVMCNPAYCRMLGYDEEEMRAKTFLDVTHPDDVGMSVDLEKTGLAAGGAPVSLEKRYLTRAGETLWVRVTVTAICDNQGSFLYWLTMAENITRSKSLEAQLRQAQKLEAVGRIAAAVAHEFNNMLAAINGYVDLVGKGREADTALVGDIQSIRGVLGRATEMTRQLLASGSRALQRMTTVDLGAIVSNLVEMLRRVVGQSVCISVSADEDLRGVRADPGQVEQALMNLALNARDAMPDGGTLTLETRNLDIDDEYAAGHPGVRAGRYVLLAVRDTGVGMDTQVQARLFEPYFTTKPEGTGLGLSTVYGTVRQSDGHITVESAPGKGTTFRIYLPAVQSC